MGLVARGRATYNPRELNASALELQKLSTQPWPLFTADSNYPPTRAKPATWMPSKPASTAWKKAVKVVTPSFVTIPRVEDPPSPFYGVELRVDV